MLICLVQGLTFGDLEISSAAAWASKIVHLNFGIENEMSFHFCFSIVVYSFDVQKSIAWAKNVMHPERDFAVSWSSAAYFGSQLPEKLVSMYVTS